MKRIILSLFVVLFSQQIFSQQLHLMLAKKERANYMPIKGNRTYSVIINTESNKQDLIKKTKDFFIEEELAEPDELESINFNDNVSEYTFPIFLRLVQTKGKGMMGVPFVHPPIYLKQDVILQFNSAGQIKMTYTNFDAIVIASADEENTINRYKGQKGKYDNEPVLDADKKIQEEYNMILSTQTKIGKALIWANTIGDKTTAEEIKKQGEEFRIKINERFNLYNEALESGSAVLISKSNIDEYQPMKPLQKSWDNVLNKFKADNYIFAVDNYRWENTIIPYLDYLIKRIRWITDGKIDNIALDGNIKYKNVDGKILPTDKKLRKTWKRQGIEF